MHFKPFAILFLFLFQISAFAAIHKHNLKKDVEFLASDQMKGRLTGTPEARKAAEYIAAEFQAAGLGVPPSASAFQSFEFTSGIKLGTNNALSADFKGARQSYVLSKDFIPVGFSEEGQLVNVPVVFAGYGIRAADKKYDNYAGLDVKGKAVLVYRFGPEGNDRKSAYSQYFPVRYKSMIARDLGATALLVLAQNEAEDELLPLRKDSSYGTSGIPVFSVRRSVALQWAKASGKNLPQQLDPHSAAGFDLTGMSISLTSNLIREKSKSENVMGWLPAATSTKETLVFGAHYDHLGMGVEGSLSPKWDVVHNGADDNASGVAGLLEMARHFGARKESLRRNILFLAFGGEELGVLGSTHFVKNPVIPLNDIVAMLNMDMIGRLKNQKLVVGGTGTSPAWKEMIQRQVHNGLNITQNPDGHGPSDHSTFYSKDIPVLFFFTGVHNEYHKPDDDAHLIEYDGMVAVLSYIAGLAEQILDLPERPKFQKVKSAAQDLPAGGFRVYLGTIPDYAEEIKGVKLSGVREGSPAQKAGLRGGDVIIEFGGKKIENIYDYTYALQRHQPGEKITIVVLRNDQRLLLEVTLERRGGSD